MNHSERKYSNRSREMASRAIAIYNRLNVVHKIAIGMVAGMLVIGMLSSFTIINKEAEPAEQHQYGSEIKVNESWHPESHYVIKIFRYFEIFPYMRTYLYRFTPTDYKKICEYHSRDSLLHHETMISDYLWEKDMPTPFVNGSSHLNLTDPCMSDPDIAEMEAHQSVSPVNKHIGDGS
jgi:hypothetical protein